LSQPWCLPSNHFTSVASESEVSRYVYASGHIGTLQETVSGNVITATEVLVDARIRTGSGVRPTRVVDDGQRHGIGLHRQRRPDLFVAGGSRNIGWWRLAGVSPRRAEANIRVQWDNTKRERTRGQWIFPIAASACGSDTTTYTTTARCSKHLAEGYLVNWSWVQVDALNRRRARDSEGSSKSPTQLPPMPIIFVA